MEWIYERDKAQPYYQGKSNGIEGHKQFLRDYADYAKLLFDSLDCKKLSVEITKADWSSYEKDMLSFLETDNISIPEFMPPNGVYRNEELNYEINVAGLTITEPEGNIRKLTPKSINEFYAECLPIVLRFDKSGNIVITGQQIIARWTTEGTVYTK